MLSTRVVTTLEEFKTLAESWNGLLRQTASDHVFLTWEWLYTWAKHYLGKHQLWLILVYKGRNRLVGIAPLYIQQVKRHGVFHFREMRFLGIEEVCSPYLDFIIPDKHKKAVLYHIYRYLHGEASGLWDTLTLSEIPAQSATIDFWDGFVQESGKVIEIAGMTVSPVIGLTGRLEDFLESIGGQERYNLQRKHRRLEQAGHVGYDQASSTQNVEKGMETFVQLHQARWAQKGSEGAFGSQRFLGFHREIAQLFSEKRWVQLDFLLLNGEPIAGIYGFTYNDRYSFYLPGFNPSHVPRTSPGILLLFHCIEEAIRQGYKEFDLLRGAADYKMAWANGLRRSLTLRHYNRCFQAAALHLLEKAKASVKVLVR